MIIGQKVILRPAIPSDARLIYEWLVASDLTPSMMGPPLFPEIPLPTREQFSADYAPHFFDGSMPQIARSYIIEVKGIPVGHINYDSLDSVAHRAELDIWLRSSRYCGKGYGSDAINTLVTHLHSEFDVQEFILRPSRRNPGAIRAYERAGFREVNMPFDEQTRRYGKGDYNDDVLLVRMCPPNHADQAEGL